MRRKPSEAGRFAGARGAVSATLLALAAASLGPASAGAPADAPGRPSPIFDLAASRLEFAAREWYLGGRSGDPGTTSKLYLLNAGSRLAEVELRRFASSIDPSSRSVQVAPGVLAEIDLDGTDRPASDEAFWIQLRSTAPVLPALVAFTRARRDGAIETLEVGPPIAGPLDDGHREWIYPDGFQGGPPPWRERERVSLLNPGPRGATARLAVRFRDGRPALESTVEVAARRVAEVDLWTRFDALAGIPGAVQGDYALTVSADVPLLSHQVRLASRLDDGEVRGSRPSLPIRAGEARRAADWYYAGGWIVPGDAAGRREATWQLLFTYGADESPVRFELTPVAGEAPAAPTTLSAPAGRSDLQFLHHEPWLSRLGASRPWGLVLRAAGPVAPAVTVAEYEPDAEGLPGAMDAFPLTPGPLATTWWLGVARHGVVAPHDGWAAAWQLLNPGPEPIRVSLHVYSEGSTPSAREVEVAAGAVVRVSGDELAPKPAGAPFAVVATSSKPFLAHAWLRATRQGDDTTRGLVSEPGVPVLPAAVAVASPR